VSLFRGWIGIVRLFTARGLVAVGAVVAYLLVGALHTMYDLDVTTPAGKSQIVARVGGEHGQSEQKQTADQHCHGCFSIAMPQPVLAVVVIETSTASGWPVSAAIVGIAQDTESPPPKHLV